MIGAAIKLVRNFRSISASEVARKAGIARSYLWRLERGERRPRYDVLCGIAAACYISASQLCLIAESLEAAKPLRGPAAEFEPAVKSHARKNARISSGSQPVAPLRAEKTSLDITIEVHRIAERAILHAWQQVERLLASVAELDDRTMAEYLAGYLDTRGHRVEVRDVVVSEGTIKKLLVVDGKYHALDLAPQILTSNPV